ncbi:MAG TPA: DUF2946 family protein [Gemmatimonadaceae bacterium]|jgi:hypothetical protein|nr:DUF2946 family protein [Gemmatimonadaceae bacterium]
MPGVLRSFHRARSRVLLVAAFLALTGQAVATLVAPAAEARASHSAPAHVESGGTHKHHSHNPNDCPACIALQITGLPQHAVERPALLTVRFTPPPATTRRILAAHRFGPKSPRAPPLLVAPVR